MSTRGQSVNEEILRNLNEAFDAVLDRPSFLRTGSFSLQPDKLAERNLPSDPEKAGAFGLSHIDLLHTVLATAKERFSDPRVTIVSLMGSDLDGKQYKSHWDQWFDDIPIGINDLDASEKGDEKPESEQKDESYYRRSGFVLSVPSARYEMGEQEVILSIGGLRKYPDSTGSGDRGILQLFVGFHVSVCTNLSATTDGVRLEMKARTTEELAEELNALIDSFDPAKVLQEMKSLTGRRVSFRRAMSLMSDARTNFHRTSRMRVNEEGRLEQAPPPERMSRQVLNAARRSMHLPFGRSQLIEISTQSMSDENFGQDPDGRISLWNLYNLFTEALKDASFEKFLEQHTLVWNSVKILQAFLAWEEVTAASGRAEPQSTKTTVVQEPRL